MSLTISLATFKQSLTQSEQIAALAHGAATTFPAFAIEKITVGSFLEAYKAWEEFLESSLALYMMGEACLDGSLPARFSTPPTSDHAKNMLRGPSRFFDYANPDFVRSAAALHFDTGAPFEPHLRAITQDLHDLRTIRNASAHITSTTQAALDALAQRILTTPPPNVSVYALLTANHPSLPPNTVYSYYIATLKTTAELICRQ
ncbi:MAG: hypothetical protein IPG98_10930 [Burkholderiales bacterium]|nr:hypothetical protein [Burkholderiales bacterium]MBK8664760.1 hypothetical protein [Burkholderiales bacterium]